MKKVFLFLIFCLLSLSMLVAQSEGMDAKAATKKPNSGELKDEKHIQAVPKPAVKPSTSITQPRVSARPPSVPKNTEPAILSNKPIQVEAKNVPDEPKPKPQPVKAPPPSFDRESTANNVGAAPIPFSNTMKEARKKLLRKGYKELGIDFQGRTIFLRAPIQQEMPNDYKYIDEDGETIPIDEAGVHLQGQTSLINNINKDSKSNVKLIPAMAFDVTMINYGSIQKGSNGERAFKFTNNGSAPLIIRNAKGSCGCVVPTFPKEPIPPGQTATVLIRYDTNRVGEFTKTVTLETNEFNKTHILTIKGNVVE